MRTIGLRSIGSSLYMQVVIKNRQFYYNCKTHLIFHAAIKQKLKATILSFFLSCEYCGDTFRRKCELEEHLMLHFENDSKLEGIEPEYHDFING